MELSSDGRPCEEGVLSLKYGLESIGSYTHSSKHCNILSITFNSKTSQYVILDSRGITGWFRNSTLNYTTRLHDFGSYKFNLLRDIIYCRSANVYFGLSKDFGVKVYNLNFIEIFSIATEGTTISRLLFDWKRSELIMISRNKFQFWKFMIVEKSRACDGLKLQREYDVPEGALVTNAEYDSDSGRLYLVCDHDIWCYDVLGQCVAHFVHSRFVLSTLAVCALCTQANVLIAGSSTGEIPIYSLNGGLITTLLNHTRVITALIAHPSDGTLFLSSSMDGTIKIFSLQMFEEVYSISVYGDGIHWMKLRSTNTLFCASTSTVSLFDLNHVCSFWGTVRSSVKSIDVVPKYAHKTSHILVYGEDKCIRIFSKKCGQKKCTVLPPPEYVGYKDNLSFSYDRVGNIIYVLFNEEQLWIYLTRTDPATRVAVWNVREIVKRKLDNLSFVVGYSSSEIPAAKDFGCGSYNERKEEEKVRCLCTETIARDLYRQRFQLSNSHNFSLLMCGMSNGILYFLDPVPPVSVVMGFRAHPTSPISKVQTLYQCTNTQIMTMIQTINETMLKIWNYETFALVHTLMVDPDVLIFSLKFTIFVSGTSSGQLRIVKLQGIQSESHEDIMCKSNVEHNGPIVDVDVLEHRKIICSCSTDQYIRLWNYQKDLLLEIKFDETLCCAAFLGSKGSLLIGLKLHLFTVSYETLEFKSDDDSDSDKSGTESLVYEDPLVRQDLRKNMEFKTLNLENYLIPYPYLSLESKWTEQAAISDDIKRSNKVISSASSSCSSTSIEYNAPTEVYADSLCSEFSVLDYDIEMPRCNADSPGFDDDSRCGSCNKLWSEIEISIQEENAEEDLSAKVLFQVEPEVKGVKVKETELKKDDKKSVLIESKPKPTPIIEKLKISSPSVKAEVKKPGKLAQSQTTRKTKKEKIVVERKKNTINHKPSPPTSRVTKKPKFSVVTKPSSKKVRKHAKESIDDVPAPKHHTSIQLSPKRTDAILSSVPFAAGTLEKAEIVNNELPPTTMKSESPMFVKSNLNITESSIVNQSDHTCPPGVKSLIPTHSLGRMRDVVSKLGVCLNSDEMKLKNRFNSTSYRTVLNSLVNEGVSIEDEEGESVIESVPVSPSKLLVQPCRTMKSGSDLVSDTLLESMDISTSGNLYVKDERERVDSGNTISLATSVNIDQGEGNIGVKKMCSRNNSQKNVSFKNNAGDVCTSACSEKVVEETKKSGWGHVLTNKRKKSLLEGLQYRSNMSDWERSRVAIMALNRIKHKSQDKKCDITDLTEEMTKSTRVSVANFSDTNPIIHVKGEKIDEDLVTCHENRLPRKNEKPKYILAGEVKPIIGTKRWGNSTKINHTTSCKGANHQKLLQNGHLVKLMRSLRMSSVLSHSYDRDVSEEMGAIEYTQTMDTLGGNGDYSVSEDVGLNMEVFNENDLDNHPVHKVTKEYDRMEDTVEEGEDPDRLVVPDQMYMSSSTSNERSEISFFLSREEMSSGMERVQSKILDDLMCLTPDVAYTVADSSTHYFPHSNDDILKDKVGIDNPLKQMEITFDKIHLSDQRMHSRLSSGYGTRSPCSDISYYAKPTHPKSHDDLLKCSHQKLKKQLSVNHSPSSVGYRSSPYQSNVTNSAVDKQQMKCKDILKEERNEQIRKLEHKMSGQPYRLHCVKSSSDYQNEMTKLMFMKSVDMGREFLRYSQRRVISIPSKKDCPGAYRECIDEYSY